MFEHIDVQAIGVITPTVTYGSVNSVSMAYAISEVWWEWLRFMEINKRFVLEKVRIYWESAKVSVKKYESYCFRRLTLGNWNSSQNPGRISTPCGLGKHLSFDWIFFENTSISRQNGAQRTKKTLQGNSAVSILGSLMKGWMMSEAWTLSMAATDIVEGREKAAEERKQTYSLQFWLGN